MANLDLTFISAGDNTEIDVELQDTQNAEQIIRELVRAKFIPPLGPNEQRSYALTIKGRGTISEGQTLAAAGVHSGDKIRVSVAQRGGMKG